MRENNVLIKVFENGELVDTRVGHNVWLDNGREYLAEMIAYSTFAPSDTPERSDRVRYMGLGIGGNRQGNLGLANSAPVVTSYPAGYDPNVSTGNTYNRDVPVIPPISTLERPVRISGGTTDYGTVVGTDVWFVDDPDLFFTHYSFVNAGGAEIVDRMNVHAVVQGSGGDIIYSPFTEMPISEAALFLSSTDINAPYEEAVAYYNFDTILFTASNMLEIIWTVGF